MRLCTLTSILALTMCASEDPLLLLQVQSFSNKVEDSRCDDQELTFWEARAVQLITGTYDPQESVIGQQVRIVQDVVYACDHQAEDDAEEWRRTLEQKSGVLPACDRLKGIMNGEYYEMKFIVDLVYETIKEEKQIACLIEKKDQDEAVAEETRRACDLECETELEAKTKQLTDLQGQFNDHESELEAKTKQLTDLQGQFNDQESELEAKTKELTDLQGQFNDQESELQAKTKELTDLQGQFNNQESELQAKTKELTDLQGQFNDQESELQAETKELTDLQGQFNDQESDLQAKTKQLTDLQGQFDEQESELQAKTKQLTDLQGQFANLQIACNLEKDELQAKTKQLTDLQGQFANLQRACDLEKDELQAKTKQLTDLQGRYNQREVDHEQVRDQLASEQQSLRDLRGRCDPLNADRLDKCHTEKRELEQRLSNASTESATITRELDNCQRLLNHTRQSIPQLTSDGEKAIQDQMQREMAKYGNCKQADLDNCRNETQRCMNETQEVQERLDIFTVELEKCQGEINKIDATHIVCETLESDIHACVEEQKKLEDELSTCKMMREAHEDEKTDGKKKDGKTKAVILKP